MNLRDTAFVTLLLALLGPRQVTTTPGPQYPLAMNTRWTYQMRQEFGPGVHPSGADAALVKGNVLETTAAPSPAAPQSVEQESSLPGVTTRIVYLRQYNGALHLGVAFKNTTDRPVSGDSFLFDHVTLTEPKGGRKHFPLKSGQGRFVAGPISDWNSGGRWWVKIPAHGVILVWALFEPIAGSTVDVSLPVSQPFDAVRVTTDPPVAPGESGWMGGTLRATITSVTRADGQMKVRLKIVSSGPALMGDALEYQDVYALDPANKRQYALVKDADGNFLAQPVSDQGKGGRYFPNRVPPRGQVFMALTFAAPPDSVTSVDIVIPQFDIFEDVPIAGEGGGGGAGAAVAGRTIGLEQALRDLHADVTPQQVKVSLSADVLFDFDKADLKPEAEPQLAELATVIKSYRGASVNIEGHSDGKGADAYNQTLSEKRAASIAQWLVAKGGADAPQLHTRGWGKTKPIAPNTKPNGSDDPEGRAKNRRVEITIAKS